MEGYRLLCYSVAVKIRGLTLGEIVDIWGVPAVEGTALASQGHAEVVVCPAEVDTLTDEKEYPGNVTGTV